MKKGLIFILFLLLYTSCTGFKPKAIGNINEIIVCADDEVWSEMEEVLREVLEKELKTPQPEKVFYLTRINPLNFADYQRFRHIVLLGILDSNGKISNYIESQLDNKTKSAVREGRYFYSIKRDEFAREQLIMYLVANDLTELKVRVIENKGLIFNQFNNALDKKVIQSMFGKTENMELSDRFFKSYGWTLRMQPDYIIAKEDSENNFVWLRRFEPDRMISVNWQDSKDGSELDENWAIERRVYIGKTYLDGMKIVDGYTKIEPIKAVNDFETSNFGNNSELIN